MSQKQFRCLIVDDEPPAHDVLKNHIAAIPSLCWVGSCFNAMEGLTALSATSVDLLFLDIQMPRLSGMEFVKTLSHRPRIIFVTAHREFAFDSYDLGAVDYLLKPVSFERFLKAVNKVTDLPAITVPQEDLSSDRFLYFRADRKLVKVWLKDVLFVESLKDYVRITTTQGTLITKLPLSSLLDRLPGEAFMQIHRSFVVSLDHVDTFGSDSLKIGKHELPVGPLYREQMRKMMEGFKWT